MKRMTLLLALVCLCALGCAAAAQSVTDSVMLDVIRQKSPGDVSAVIEAEGRVAGPVVGVNPETGETGERLYVDALLPEKFGAGQRVIITAEPIEIDRAALTDALLASGAQLGQMTVGHGFAYNDDIGQALPHEGEPLAHAEAVDIAQRFVAACGLGDTYVVSDLRPEEEARGLAAQEAPEAQEAAYARTLREWHRKDTAYTSVCLGFTLRGLPVAQEWQDEQGTIRSSVVHLDVGDAGEIRDYGLFYAPREVDAEPWTGELKTWREALAEYSAWFGEHNNEPRTDDRGREAPPLRRTITSVRPGYASADGKTYVPAWLFIDNTFALDGDAATPVNSIWTAAIDARVGY